ncbi:hypothetical protein, partial [Klebsiella aerogenes]|uniref:hypothetical protein n=1 Tax=Klebsiella aerogenes TaxID=548 RepID=UPI001954C80F
QNESSIALALGSGVYTLLLGMTKVTIILFYIRLCHVYTLFCHLCWACILIISQSTGVFTLE